MNTKEFNKLLKKEKNKSKILTDYMKGDLKLYSWQVDKVMKLRKSDEIGKGGCRVGRRLEND